VLGRRLYDEARGRCDYVLTDEGRALWPVLNAIRQWGDEWVMGEGNEPLELLHTRCGCYTQAVQTCDQCGEELLLDEVRSVPGPALHDESFLPRFATPR
jgi:hypothetical protein